MIKTLALTAVLTGSMLAGGCATKKFVRNTSAPIQAKVDQVGEQTNRNTAGLEDTRKELKGADERAESGISAAKERALTADNNAGEAMNKAGEAMNKATEASTAAADAQSHADKNTTELASLRGVVSNIDDYKLASETTVNFGLGKDKLTPEGKDALDKLAGEKANLKRFVIAVEGYTDKTGTQEFNAALSQRRASAVVNYLVTKHEIPLYRIYTVGLGAEKPADDGKTREARSKNRRVEVRIFSADQITTLASR